MPQIEGGTVKARAARLRRLGTERVAAFLAGQMGLQPTVLVESARMGRTEQFAEVIFATDQPVGRIVAARVVGHDGTRLLAEPA
jgi:threonylcarbamoyladenosine tRNA methylthiotransferase MtaB